MKERVTLTIDNNVLQKVDQKIDGKHVKNRSHAVELLLTEALGTVKPRKAFIIAGGLGTRLKPITHELPKPLIPVQGKPIIEHLLDLFKKHDIRDITISIGYKGDKIKEHLGNGQRYGVTITYVEEKTPLGTAGPLKLAKRHLNETFIMTNADELKNINLHQLFNFHKDKQALATIALTTVENPQDYGVAIMEGSEIKQFLEKPTSPPSNLINAGLYVLEPSVIDLVPDGPCSIEKDIFPQIAQQKKLHGYPFPGQWYDTGTLERYEKAIKEWKGL